ncbi:unnamed protein product [Triticum turgidum subsp. durum]|uniref:Uncharacterized protein n=1 Tax=Triticum turgidum subsp. durum TaxID=4567 RepID=A0A9R0Y0F3_TRITD|nr:unnamed protein product [Triticum turgidum subsp. durum]
MPDWLPTSVGSLASCTPFDIEDHIMGLCFLCADRPLQFQRLSTIPQHHWVSKLSDYDFSIEFLLGKLNIVADALFRRDSREEDRDC